MVDVSDRYFRYLTRLLTKKSTIYTEMINEHAVLYSRRCLDQLIGFDESEHPIVL
jgi:tRNA-dihydrouridine synthase A